MSQDNMQQDWREEFDKVFPGGVYSVEAHQDQGGDYSLTKDVKEFIATTLEQRDAEFSNAIRKANLMCSPNTPRDFGFNEHFELIDKALTQLNNNK